MLMACSVTVQRQTKRSRPINSRAEAFGCKVVVADGHDMDEIDQAINHTDHKGQPLVVLCYQ